jgi:hypothetical protein
MVAVENNFKCKGDCFEAEAVLRKCADNSEAVSGKL